MMPQAMMMNPWNGLVEFALMFAALFAAPPPEDGAKDAPPAAMVAHCPADAWAVATFDLYAMRRDVATWIDRVDGAKFPALPENGRALLDAWRAENLPVVAERLGMGGDELKAAVDRVRRAHVVVHGLSAMGPGVAVVLEGFPAARADGFADALRRLLPALEGEGEEEGEAPARPTLDLGGRKIAVVATAVGGLYVAPAPGDRLIVANSLPLAKRLALPAEQAGPTLGARLAEYRLTPPADDDKVWAFVNLPEFLPYLPVVDAALQTGNHRGGGFPDARLAVGPMALADAFLDLSSVGPVTLAEKADGTAVTRVALSPTSEWRRWLGGKDFRHDALAVADGALAPFLAFSMGLADAPGLAQAWSARAAWALDAWRDADGRVGDRDVDMALSIAENLDPWLGESLPAFAARFREIGVRVDALPGLPPEVQPEMLAMTMTGQIALHFRLAADGDPVAVWDNLRKNPTLAEALPALADPDANGVRLALVPLPIPDFPLPVAVATQGDRLVIALNADKAKAAVAAVGRADDAYGRSTVNLQGILDLARAAVPDVRAAVPEAARALVAEPQLETMALDDTGIRGEVRGPVPFWLQQTAALGMGFFAGVEGRNVESMLGRLHPEAAYNDSTSNLKQLAMYVFLYEADHEKPPASIDAIRAWSDPFPEEILACPVTGEAYVFVPEGANPNVKRPSAAVMFHSAPITKRDGAVQRAVAFRDGHVEWMDEDAFTQRLADTKAEQAKAEVF